MKDSATNLFSYTADSGVERLVIFGAGGFGREVAWLAHQLWQDTIEITFAVDEKTYLTGPVNDIPVTLLSDIEPTSETRYVVAIGDPALRQKSVAAIERTGLSPATLVHPRSEMSRWVELGFGTIVCAGVIATTNIKVGVHAHINLGCTIGHDVSIGSFTTLAPGVHVSGHVEIGSNAYVGTGASIINGREGHPLVIGDGAVIAAGSCVIESVPPGALVAGVPAIRKR